MGQLTITGLDEEVLARLSRRAAELGRSVEAEAMAILLAEVAPGRRAKAIGDDHWWEHALERLRQTAPLNVDMTELIREGRDER